MSAERCGARAVGGPCTMERAHNMGNLDIPSAHNAFAATSSSDRYAEARAALDHFESFYGQGGTATARILAALRALIEPAAVNEDVEGVALRVQADHASRGDFAGLAVALVHAGIQAAWESWEPDDYAPTCCDKCGADA